MDHVALISSIPAPTKAHLTARSDVAGLKHLLVHVSALCLTSTGIVQWPDYWHWLLLPHAVLLIFLFALSHECTHFTPFRSRWLNVACGHAAGVLLLLPFTWFRLFHLAHHQHTNDPLRDPELAGGPRPCDPKSWLVYLTGWGYWRGMAEAVWANALGGGNDGGGGGGGESFGSTSYLPRRHHAAVVREARCYLAVYALAVLAAAPGGPAGVLLWRLWALPLLVGQPFLRVFLLAEHGLCPPVRNMLENSRTTLAGSLVRRLAWNMSFHAEHHALPSVPFHRLPELHAAWAAPHLKSTSAGYAEFTREYAASLLAHKLH